MQEIVTVVAIIGAVVFYIWYFYDMFVVSPRKQKQWDEYNKESKRLHEEYCRQHLEKTKMYGTPFYPGWDNVQQYIPPLPE